MTQTLCILGGCGGIGRELTRQALQRGACVTILDLAASIDRHPPPAQVVALAVDATDRVSLRRALADAFAVEGAFDGFVVLSGFTAPAQALAETPSTVWDAVIAGNLRATYLAATEAVPFMKTPGAMVLTGSGLGYVARPGYGPYAVAKAGVSAIGRQLALELAPLLRVNTVAPAAVDTAFLRGGTGRSDETATPRLDPAAYAGTVPLARIAQPGDIVGPILFLLSDDAAFMTGQTLHVNGGTYMP